MLEEAEAALLLLLALLLAAGLALLLAARLALLAALLAARLAVRLAGLAVRLAVSLARLLVVAGHLYNGEHEKKFGVTRVNLPERGGLDAGPGTMSPTRILILDTETNGLPSNRFAPPSQWDAYPAILQLSWVVYTVEEGGRQLGLPEINRDIGIALHPSIPWNAGAAAVHGLSESEGRRGTPAAEALTELAAALRSVDVVVAHNLSFDKPVIRAAAYAEAERGGPSELRSIWPTSIAEFCTMRNLRDIVRIPSPYYVNAAPGEQKWKAPKLNEVYSWLYGHVYDVSGATLHSARSDTHCLSQVLAGCLRRGVITAKGRRLLVSDASTPTAT